MVVICKNRRDVTLKLPRQHNSIHACYFSVKGDNFISQQNTRLCGYLLMQPLHAIFWCLSTDKVASSSFYNLSVNWHHLILSYPMVRRFPKGLSYQFYRLKERSYLQTYWQGWICTILRMKIWFPNVNLVSSIVHVLDKISNMTNIVIHCDSLI